MKTNNRLSLSFLIGFLSTSDRSYVSCWQEKEQRAPPEARTRHAWTSCNEGH